MLKLERIYQNVVLAVSIGIVLIGTVGFGAAATWQQHRLSSCLYEMEDEANARGEQRQSVNAPSATAPGEQQKPADTRQQIRQATEEGAKVAPACMGLGPDVGTALARASYDLSLLGYFATLLFGMLGVMGIFLGYSASRDARDDARRQATAAADRSTVGGSSGGGSAAGPGG